MHVGYMVYFHERGFGYRNWGKIAIFRLGEEARAAEFVERLKSGEVTHIDGRIGPLDPEKYDFGYMETWY